MSPTAADAGVEDRLDRATARIVPGLSRGAARRLIDAGSVFVNGRRCRIASRLVRAGDVIAVHGQESAPSAPADLTILFEDDRLIAVAKPAGMPTAPTRTASRGSALDTMQRQLRSRDGQARLWLTHRLDAPASGVVVMAKTRAVAAGLSDAFRARRVEKVYVAVVGGVISDEGGRIEQAIRRVGRKVTVDAFGQPARTDWRVLHRGEATTLVELRPHSGRMHQLRVHMSAAGHPIVGDRLYGGPPAHRLMLHARSIRFPPIGGKVVPEIVSPWPQELGPAP